VKQLTKSISDFILAFDLLHPINGVCFDAMVFFYTDKLVLQIESEVHIITILNKKIDVLYILNPEIRNRELPDMFESKHCEINFREKKGLLLKSVDDQNRSYSILIQPTGKSCEPVTLEEIQQRINN
jgi:hypothetical protein